MSINILYCEGGNKSPDIRVLTNILSGVCTVNPARSKYGLDQNILFIRRAKILAGITIAALRDRDFDDDDSLPISVPRSWLKNDNDQLIQIGWLWERKEIENYLIDPEVVQLALGSKAPPIDDYRAEIEKSAKTIVDYTAARIALSLPTQSSLLLKNNWGNTGINKKHLFPDYLRESDCRDAIKNIINQYQQSKIIQENDILDRFDQLLLTCRVGGSRFQNFLTFFSGKDLLY